LLRDVFESRREERAERLVLVLDFEVFEVLADLDDFDLALEADFADFACFFAVLPLAGTLSTASARTSVKRRNARIDVRIACMTILEGRSIATGARVSQLTLSATRGGIRRRLSTDARQRRAPGAPRCAEL
jgi:hypothetical protein